MLLVSNPLCAKVSDLALTQGFSSPSTVGVPFQNIKHPFHKVCSHDTNFGSNYFSDIVSTHRNALFASLTLNFNNNRLRKLDSVNRP